MALEVKCILAEGVVKECKMFNCHVECLKATQSNLHLLERNPFVHTRPTTCCRAITMVLSVRIATDSTAGNIFWIGHRLHKDFVDDLRSGRHGYSDTE